MKVFNLIICFAIFGFTQSQNYQSIANNHLYWDLGFAGERNFSLDDTTFICLKLQKFRCFDDSLNLKWEYRDKKKGNSIATNIVRNDEGFCFLTKSRSKASEPKSKINLIKLDYSGNEIYIKTMTDFNPRYLYQFKEQYVFSSKKAVGIVKNDAFTKHIFPEGNYRFQLVDQLQIDNKIHFLGYRGPDMSEDFSVLSFDILTQEFEEYEVPIGNIDLLLDLELISSKGELFLSMLNNTGKRNNTYVELYKFEDEGFKEVFQEKIAADLTYVALEKFENGNILIAVQEESSFEESETFTYEKVVEKGTIYYYILSQNGTEIKYGEIKRSALWSLAISQYSYDNSGSDLGMYKASMMDASNRSERFTSVSCIIDGNDAFFTLPVGKNLSMAHINEREEKYYANILESAEGESFNKIYLSPRLGFKSPGGNTFGFIFSNTVTPGLVDLTNKLYLVKVEEMVY